MVKRMQEQGYEVVSLGKTAHGATLGPKLGFDYIIPDIGAHPVDDSKLMGDVETYLNEPKSEKPKCIFVGDRRPHSPWYHPSIYPLANDPSYPEYLVDDVESREMWGSYLTDVTSMDETMGKVEKKMREYFGGDDFIFMYTSDHGAGWPFNKASLYDGGIRVPMIVRWPGNVKKNVRTDAMVSWIDIIPTFVDIAGGGEIENIDGKSFKRVLFDKNEEHRDCVYAIHNCKVPGDYINRAVRTDKYKYIRNYSHENYFIMIHELMQIPRVSSYWTSWYSKYDTDPEARAIIDKYHNRPYEEFYDITVDPTEQKNLALDSEYKGEMAKLSKMLDEWMIEQNDVIKMPSIYYPKNERSIIEIMDEVIQKFYNLKAHK